MTGGEIHVQHPYVPTDLHLPDYVPCFLSQYTIIGVYTAASLLVCTLIWILSGRSPKLSNTDRMLMCWWAFTGLTHFILEGYFVISPDFYKSPSYLAEVWKEFSKCDSRYPARDSAVVAVEGITSMLEGPASLLAMYAIAARKPYSYILQLAVCLGQLYCCLVYYITSYLEGDNFAASPYYYWLYYVIVNSIWVVIPTLIAIRCWYKISAAFELQKKCKTP